MPPMTSAKAVPGVRFPVGRTPALGVVLLALTIIGALLGIAAWSSSASQADGRWGVVVVAWLCVSTGLWRFWRQQTRRWLAFDGEAWSIQGRDVADPLADLVPLTSVHVVFDWQRSLLLQLKAGTSDRRRMATPWIWAARQADPQRWHLLRAALYSPPARLRELPDQPSSA